MSKAREAAHLAGMNTPDVAAAGTAAIDVRQVVKRYGDFIALHEISLAIRDNEFFTLLGPSGCGKTTLLRLIAGLEDVTEGSIQLFGQEIGRLPPYKRPVNTVFQDYALFPHMTVLDNVAFGLEMLGTPRREALSQAQENLALVQLDDFARRRPAQLSGGQQQRVALARALAPQPRVLLLDEPLSALDLKLRKAMQLELKQLQRNTGITFIFVTHDQEEALTMSDRVAVMSGGALQQLGTARDIYERPVNRFVADFIGQTNLVRVTVERIEGALATCNLGGGNMLRCAAVDGVKAGQAAHVSIRPERLILSPQPTDGTTAFRGRTSDNIFMGTDTTTLVEIEGGPVLAVRTSNSDRGNPRIVAPGSIAHVTVEQGAARLLPD